MPKARLLFSHSTEDGSAERAALMTVADALHADDYEILLDRSALKAGGDWRPTIDEWIGACHAAVVLITPGSIASKYCTYEWSVLSYRRRKDRQFVILPIYLGSIPRDVTNRPDQIAEISGYFGFQDIASIIPDLKQRLAAEVDLAAETRNQLNLIAGALRDTVTEKVIDTEARNMNIDLGGWDFAGDKFDKFAIKVMDVGLIASFDALQDLRRIFGKPKADEFRAIVQLIGRCSWVDLSAAQRIRAWALRDAAVHDLFGLNADVGETAKCYVLTGSDKHPDDNWPVGVHLDDFASEPDLHRRVREALIEALEFEEGDPSDADIREKIDFQRELKQPIFILLKGAGLSVDVLQRLRGIALFAGVHFLVLTGEAGIPGLLPEDAVLKPELRAGFERKVWRDYGKITTKLGLPPVRAG